MGTLGLVFLVNDQFSFVISLMPEAIPDSSYSKKTLHPCSLFYFILHAIVSMLMVLLLLFCVYVSVRLFCAEACVYEAVHVCAHMWKPENNIRYHFSDSIHLCLEARVFHWSGITPKAVLSSRDLLISSVLQSLLWN